MEIQVDAEGHLVLPAGLVSEAGLRPGDTVAAQPGDGRLTLQRGDAVPALREQMLELADSMREVDAPPGPAPPPASGEGGIPAGLFSFEGKWPVLGKGCYVAPGAAVIGAVELGDECSVWPGAVLRGDVNVIRVGPRCNIQDGAVLHSNPGDQVCRLGTGVSVGHQACVHACVIGDYALIGIHATVLDGATVGERAIVGAGAVVTPGSEIPARTLALGVPARVVRSLEPEEIASLERRGDIYAGLKDRYLAATAPRSTAAPAAIALPRYDCPRTRDAVIVDGRLDEAVWQSLAPKAALRDAATGRPPVLETHLQACWDDRCLYLAFHCEDTDVWGTMIQRDQPLYDEEVVEAFLCPTGDLSHYFEIEVNPRNAVFDARVFSPEHRRQTMLVDRDWDAAGLWTATAVSGTLDTRSDTDTGWTAEIAIPFTAMGLEGPPAPGSIWRCNFYRIERGRVTEFSAWSPTLADPPDFHLPERFGELCFAPA